MEGAVALMALGLGLATSLHCVGMCGPIAFSLGLNSQNKFKFAFKNLTYQLGRVTTYSLLGVILGVLGQGLSLAGFQQNLSIFVGVLMIAMVFLPKNLGEQKAVNLNFFSNIMLNIKIGIGKFLRKKDFSSLYMTGLLNGLLPCGAVYTALTAAIGVGSVSKSFLFMFLFGIGTIPFMFATVLFGNFISVQKRQQIIKILPVITIVLGILFILRGLELNIPFISPAAQALELNSDIDCVNP